MWSDRLRSIERENQWFGELVWVAIFICVLIVAWVMAKR